MPGSTYSTNLKVELMATGENSGTWGDITNTNLGTALEQAIVGYGNPDYASDANLTISITNSNAAQAARALVLNVTSSVSLTATRELVVPTIQKQYIVQNNTTGSQSITVKTSAGTGITVPNGRKAHLYVNGTDVIQMFDFVDINGGAIDGTPIGASSASTGAFTTLNASGATTLDGNVTLGNASGDNVTVTGTITSNLLFTDNTYDIGASGATRPRNLFLAGAATIGGNLSVGGTLTLTGGLILNGNVTVGDSSADTLTVNATITSNLLFTDNTYDIGASGATRPRNLFLAGNATIGGNQTLTGSLTVDSTTDSSSTTTGSIQTDGGLGVAKAAFIGTNLNVAGNTTLGDAAADTLTVNSTITSNLIFTDNTYDIGASGATRPRSLYLASNAYVTGTLFMNGANPAISLNGNAVNQAATISNSNGGSTSISVNSAALYFQDDNLVNFATFGKTETVFNETGRDTDFRIESDTRTHMFFVDASANAIGINISNPLGPLFEIRSDRTNGASANALTLSDPVTGTQTAGKGNQIVWYSNNYATYAALAFEVGSDGTNNQSQISLYTQATAGGASRKLMVGATGELIATPIAGTGAVFNEDGVDADFRVESDTNTHALFVDAGADAVAIGTATTSAGKATIYTAAGNTLVLQKSGGASALAFGSDTTAGFLQQAISGGGMDFYTGTGLWTTPPTWTKRFTIGASETVVNEDSTDYDFRVESDTNAYALFLDAGQSRVYFGGSTSPNAGSPVLVTNGYAAVDTTTVGGDPSATSILSTARFSIGGSGGNYLTFGANTNNTTAWIQSSYFVPNTAKYDLVLNPLGGGVGVNRSTASYPLHIQGQAAIEDATNPILYLIDTGNSTSEIGVSGLGAGLDNVYIAGYGGRAISAYDFRITGSSGEITTRVGGVINESGADSDFRVESDTNTHAFFLDAGNSRVGLFTSAPASAFDSHVPTNEASVQRTVSDTTAAISANLVESRVASFNVASGTNFVISNTAVSASGWRVIFRGTWSNNYEGSGLQFYAPYIEVNSANPSTTIGSRTVTVSRNGSGFLIVNSGDAYRNSFAGTIEVYDNPQSQQPNQSMRLLGGIQFPATQNASSNANTLDDYEEGTWSPTLLYGSAPATVGEAKYIKIGQFVFCNIDVTLATQTNAFDCLLSLPFPWGSNWSAGSFNYNSYSNTLNINGDAGYGAYVGFRNAPTGANVSVTALSGARLIFAFSYRAST